jgi:hypothetical protein
MKKLFIALSVMLAVASCGRGEPNLLDVRVVDFDPEKMEQAIEQGIATKEEIGGSIALFMMQRDDYGEQRANTITFGEMLRNFRNSGFTATLCEPAEEEFENHPE